jgi:polysaccharide biosynthesis protein VpsI
MQNTSPSAPNPRVLVVTPGHQGRGGIDSVVRLHQSTEVWRSMCSLLETYNDRSASQKVLAALKGYVVAPFKIVQAEIVHFHLAGEISLLRKLPIVAASLALRRKLVIHIHASGEESLFVKTPRWAWKFVLGNADRVLALSPTWARVIESHLTKAKVEVLPNPVKTFSPAPLTNPDQPRVLYVGKLEARKGFNNLIDAAAIVLKEFPQAEFWFAGHGDLEAAREQAERLGIQSQIHLLGWRAGEELEAIYQQANLFCLPSFNEGVPMSMLEAMSHGLPVVCTRVGGIPDVVREGENALYAEPGNAHSIADSLLRLMRAPLFAETMAREARRTVLERFSLDIVEKRLGTLYRDLVSVSEESASKVLHEA